MYHEFYGLKQAPFKITPDTRLFFSGGKRGEILEALVYAISSGEGIVKVVGEVGSGKTMLCRMLEVRLSEEVEIVYLPNPSLTPEDILHAIALELGIKVGPSANRIHVMQALHRHLLERHSTNKRIVVFVEEAQSMPLETLEEIRLLSNLETQRDKLLQIVLFGQPELDRNLNKKEIRQLRERITHSFSLPPLSGEDIREYVQFRLRAVGYRGPDVFDPKAYKAIALASEGLTRRVNILADKCLLAAFAENTHNVTLRQANKAIVDSELAKPSLRLGRTVAIAASLLLVVALGYGIVKDNFEIARNLAAWANNQLNPALQSDPNSGEVVASATVMKSSDESVTPSGVDAVASQTGSDDLTVTDENTTVAGASTMQQTQSQTEMPQAETLKSKMVDAEKVLQTTQSDLEAAQPLAADSLMVSKAADLSAVSGVRAEQSTAEVVDSASEKVAEALQAAGSNRIQEPEVQLTSISAAVKQEPLSSESTQSLSGDQASTGLLQQEAQANDIQSSAAADEQVDAAGQLIAEQPASRSLTNLVFNRLPVPKFKSVPSTAELAGTVAEYGMGLLDERMSATQDWLKITNPEHYTIQLLATHVADVEALLDLLRRWNLAGRLSEVYVYRTRVGETDWYGVLYSDFESFTSARAALRELPRDIQQAKPFVRNVRDISKLG